MKFDSQYVDRGSFNANFTQDEIKNEPMFFNCDVDFAWQHGGPITREFIMNMPSDWFNCNPVLDSRVHMLMPGWFPCIPGYHHDDVPRSTATGQPNYVNPEYHSRHLMGLVNGDICPTEFAIGVVEVSEPNIGDIIYKRWHKEVEQQVQSGLIKSEFAHSGRYIEFDWQTFHTGTRAIAGGWRWFIRASRFTDRQTKMTNEIRRQVQVYLEFPMEGW